DCRIDYGSNHREGRIRWAESKNLLPVAIPISRFLDRALISVGAALRYATVLPPLPRISNDFRGRRPLLGQRMRRFCDHCQILDNFNIQSISRGKLTTQPKISAQDNTVSNDF